jgi:hypothetical protein
MKSRSARNALLAAGVLAFFSPPASMALRPVRAAGEEPAAPAYEKQVNLVYTVNNFGFIDVCG